MRPTLRIDFVSDVVCPWCAIGLKSLEAAAARIPKLKLELHFQPFELNPAMGPEGQDIDEHLQQKYGASPAQMAGTRAAIRDRGAELGFDFRPAARNRIYNTFDAHRLLHWAGSIDLHIQRQLKLACLEAYFTEGLDVSSHEVLTELAVVAGLDADQARQLLASDRYAAEVRADERQWQDLGIHAVPAVIVAGRHLIQGGQSIDVFEKLLRQIAEEPAGAT
jgi:predicted DsbA family dithiol-disulfide isomerase